MGAEASKDEGKLAISVHVRRQTNDEGRMEVTSDDRRCFVCVLLMPSSCAGNETQSADQTEYNGEVINVKLCKRVFVRRLRPT